MKSAVYAPILPFRSNCAGPHPLQIRYKSRLDAATARLTAQLFRWRI